MNPTIKRIFSPRNIIALVLLLLCLVLLLLSCKPRREYRTTEGLVFGTVYHVTYAATEPLDAVIDSTLRRVDFSLSLFNRESTLARLNRGETVARDSLFEYVYNRGMEISRATDGRFDMTVAPLVNLWGFGIAKRGTNFDSIAACADSIRATIGYDKCHLIIEGDSMRLEGARLDAAAIAKGYASDLVARALTRAGATDCCVEIGGEVAVRGHNPQGEEWRIGINRPVSDSLNYESDPADVLRLTDSGMATSGNYRNFYRLGARQVAHTIDPRTARPVFSNVLSATIVAPDCITADAFATASMVAGLDSAIAMVAARPELRAYFIHKVDKRLYVTSVENGKLNPKKPLK